MSLFDTSTVHVQRPADTSLLAARLLQLSVVTDPSIFQHVELASITKLLHSPLGFVTRSDVSAFACAFLGIRQNEQSIEHTPYVLQVVDDVWQQLTDLVEGIATSVTDAPGPDSNTASQWLNRVMERMDRELNDGRLSEAAITNVLPDSVRQRAAYRMTSNEYGSPYALGYSLATMKIASFGNLTFGDKGQPAWFADAMATALLEAIDVFCHEEAHSESAQVELGKIVLWTMLLKAFLYGLVYDKNQDHGAFRVMAENMAIVEHVHAALLAGIRHIENSRQVQHLPIPEWEDRTTTHDKKIEDADPDDLLTRLDTLVTRTADNMNDSTPL